jgi:hypothetical protein
VGHDRELQALVSNVDDQSSMEGRKAMLTVLVEFWTAPVVVGPAPAATVNDVGSTGNSVLMLACCSPHALQVSSIQQERAGT